MASPPDAPRRLLTSDFPDGIGLDDLRFSIPIAQILAGPDEFTIEGGRLTVTEDALREIVAAVALEVTNQSRERIESLLAAMESHPRLRPVRWYYASLFRVAGLRDELMLDASFVEGGIDIRARFAQSESGNLLRQLRDRARNLATVTARVTATAVDGALHLRLDLSPDVNGLLVNLVLNNVARPGVTRVDSATVRIDLAAAVAAQSAEIRPRPRLDCAVQSVRIGDGVAVLTLG